VNPDIARRIPPDGDHGTVDIITLFDLLGLALEVVQTTVDLDGFWGDGTFGFEHGVVVVGRRMSR
jgi:hypothetical protein